MRTHGDIVIVEGSDYLCKDIYESDNLSPIYGGRKTFDNGVIWNLCYAPNFEININREAKIPNPPKYFIFYPWYPDHTMDVIRFDIKEPKYLTGYNETRKFYKDELEWVIEVLHLYEDQEFTNWDWFLKDYNDENILNNIPEEKWPIPNYNLLETED